MTAMHEEWIGGQPVANRSAGATTLTRDAHDRLLENNVRTPDTIPGARLAPSGCDRPRRRTAPIVGRPTSATAVSIASASANCYERPPRRRRLRLRPDTPRG